jgi:hypothetical protein
MSDEQTIQSTDAATGIRVVARGPMRTGPEFKLGRGPALFPPTETRGAWRRFYEAEKNDGVQDDGEQMVWVGDHTLLDREGRPLAPVVEACAVECSGYIITWTQTFWREGFFVFDGRPAFLAIGAEGGFNSFNGLVRLVTGGAGVRVDRAGLDAYLSEEFWRLDLDWGLRESEKVPGLLQP